MGALASNGTVWGLRLHTAHPWRPRCCQPDQSLPSGPWGDCSQENCSRSRLSAAEKLLQPQASLPWAPNAPSVGGCSFIHKTH